MSADDVAARLGALVADPEALRAEDLFIVEGREAIVSLLEAPLAIESLLLTTAARVALDPKLAGRQVRVCDVTPARMRDVTGFNFHRGALAFVHRPPTRGPGDVVAEGLASHPDGAVFVVAEHLVDVDNVGSCFRNARAFGVAGVLLDDRCPDPLYRKAIRTSMGAVLRLPWTQAPVSAVVDSLEAAGVQLVALDVAGTQTMREARMAIDRTRPVAFVVGNEGQGLSPSTLARMHHRARIPMAAGADSLNVATALAVALYEHSR